MTVNAFQQAACRQCGKDDLPLNLHSGLCVRCAIDNEVKDQAARNLGFRSAEDAAEQVGYAAGQQHDQANPQKQPRRLSVKASAEALAAELKLYPEVRPAFVEAYRRGCRAARSTAIKKGRLVRYKGETSPSYRVVSLAGAACTIENPQTGNRFYPALREIEVLLPGAQPLADERTAR